MRSSLLSALLALSATVMMSAQTASSLPGQLVETATLVHPNVAVLPSPPASLSIIDKKQDAHTRHLWAISICAVLGASAADAATSWGKLEGNGLLASSDGTFGVRGVSVKAGIAAAVLIPQLMLHDRKELRSKFILTNFAEAGIFTGVAIHNLRVTAPTN